MSSSSAECVPVDTGQHNYQDKMCDQDSDCGSKYLCKVVTPEWCSGGSGCSGQPPCAAECRKHDAIKYCQPKSNCSKTSDCSKGAYCHAGSCRRRCKHDSDCTAKFPHCLNVGDELGPPAANSESIGRLPEGQCRYCAAFPHTPVLGDTVGQVQVRST